MGRLVRRYIRVHQITVTKELTLSNVRAIASTEDLKTINAVTTLNAGVILTGKMYSAYIETNLNSTSQVTSYYSALRIEMWAASDAIINQLSAIYMGNYIEVQPTSRYAFLDLRENAGITVGCFAYVGIGAAADITDLFVLPSNKTAWNATTPPPGTIQGRIAVNVSGVQRYLALHN